MKITERSSDIRTCRMNLLFGNILEHSEREESEKLNEGRTFFFFLPPEIKKPLKNLRHENGDTKRVAC